MAPDIFEGVRPTAGIPLLEDSALQLTVISDQLALDITLHAVVLLQNGRLTRNQRTYTIVGDESVETFTMDLTVGFLISASVETDELNLERGDIFCHVQLQKSTLTGAAPLQILISDYLTTNFPLTYPGSQIRQSTEGKGGLRVITASPPGAGVAAIEASISNRARYRLIFFQCTLTADANSGTRDVTATITGAGGIVLASWSHGVNSNQGANDVFVYNFAHWGDNVEVVNDFVHCPIPLDIHLGFLSKIRLFNTNAKAGDAWGTLSIFTERWYDT